MGRLELPSLATYASETYAYTSSATCPLKTQRPPPHNASILQKTRQIVRPLRGEALPPHLLRDETDGSGKQSLFIRAIADINRNAFMQMSESVVLDGRYVHEDIRQI